MKHGRDDHNPEAQEEIYLGTLFPRHRLELAGSRLVSRMISEVSEAIQVADTIGMLNEEIYHSYTIDGDRLSVASTKLKKPYVDNPGNYVAITVNRRWDSSFDKLAGRLLVSEYVIDTRPESGAIANSIDLIDLERNGSRIKYPTNLGVISRDTTGRSRVYRGKNAQLSIPASPYVTQYTIEDVSRTRTLALFLQATLNDLSPGTEDKRYPFDSL